MTGADILGALLYDHPPLLAVVPVDRIKGGRLPPDTPLPALLVRLVSSVDRPRLRRGASDRLLDRASVTVRAASYDEQIWILDLVVDACSHQRGAIAGATNVSVLTAGRGPDVAGPADSFEQAQDFRIGFDKPVSRGE